MRTTLAALRTLFPPGHPVLDSSQSLLADRGDERGSGVPVAELAGNLTLAEPYDQHGYGAIGRRLVQNVG